VSEQALILAALAWYDQRGPEDLQGPDRDLALAIAQFRSSRTRIERARDEFLALYPTPEALEDAVNKLRRDQQHSRRAYERMAGVDVYGETVDVGPVQVNSAWVTPGGFLCCQRHIDGCPPGDDHDRAWHRLQIRGLTGPDDPDGHCGKLRPGSNCMLRPFHQGSCDDLGTRPNRTPG
jgi:hypothetical protein